MCHSQKNRHIDKTLLFIFCNFFCFSILSSPTIQGGICPQTPGKENHSQPSFLWGEKNKGLLSKCKRIWLMCNSSPRSSHTKSIVTSVTSLKTVWSQHRKDASYIYTIHRSYTSMIFLQFLTTISTSHVRELCPLCCMTLPMLI